MNFARAAFQQTRPVTALRINSKDSNKCRKCLTGLRHYAAARPLKGDTGGMTNLQVALLTGGASYVAAHAVYVAWSDRLSSQKSHPVSSEENQKDEVDEAEGEIEEVIEVANTHEEEAEVVLPKEEQEVTETTSLPKEEPGVTVTISLPKEEPQVTETTSHPKEQSEVNETTSVPKEEPEVASISETISEVTENEFTSEASTKEFPNPEIVPETTVKDVLIRSDASVNIVMGAPVPRHPVCVDSPPALSSNLSSEDVTVRQAVSSS